MLRHVLLLVLAAILAVPATHAQDWAAVDHDVQVLVDSARVEGLGLAIIRRGRLVHAAGFGVRSSVTRPPVDTLTVFEAASLTKPVVALAALQLASEGVLDLDRPILEYAVYNDVAHDPRDAQVTARMLLSHSSGLPNWRTSGAKLEFAGDPGIGFLYSGEGFVWLQYTMERLTGRPLHAIVRDRVFGPLGMTSSSLIWREEFGAHVAVGHLADGTALDKFTPETANAAYSLHTTAADYARFLAATLDGVLLPSVLAGDQRARYSDSGEGIAWGLGWGLERTEKGEALWHWGDNSGYKAFVAGYPSRGDGFVMFTNSDNGMLLLHKLVEVVDGVAHPAVEWLDYERFDSPSFQLGRAVADAMFDSGIEAAVAQYRQLQESGNQDAFNEDVLNDLGYRLLRMGRTDEAVAIFELNVAEYPDAPNPHDSLGEVYLGAGRLDEALASYRRSVELDPLSDSGRAMISQIEQMIANR